MLGRILFRGLAALIDSFVESFDEQHQSKVRAITYVVVVLGIIGLGVLAAKLEEDGDTEFREPRSAAEVNALLREEFRKAEAQAEADLPIPAPSFSEPAAEVEAAVVTPEPTPAMPSPDDPELEPARLLMASARQKWDEGDRKASLLQAEKALVQYTNHLGPEHPKVAEVRAMVQAAAQ